MSEPRLPLEIPTIRSLFPALARTENGRQVVYLDGPGGTQVLHTVIDAISDVLRDGVSNLGGSFSTFQLAEQVTHHGRQAMADLFNAGPGEISFGQNMTSITLAVSRALARQWRTGDSSVLTSLDHDANFTSWVVAAKDAGVEVRIAHFDPTSGVLDPEAVADRSTTRFDWSQPALPPTPSGPWST